MALIRHHFPESTLDKAVGRHKHRLGIWRSEYNRGLLVGRPPAVFSVSYYNGKPVDATGKELKDAELVERQKRFLVIGSSTISLKAVNGGTITLEVQGASEAVTVRRSSEVEGRTEHINSSAD